MTSERNTDDMRIRPATVGDIGTITAIYADAVSNGTASYELDPPDPAEMEKRFVALNRAGFPYIVAESDDRILGYAYAGPFRTRPAYRFIVEDSIYLSPDARGRGIGRLLLEQLVLEVERLGFRQIVAVIGDGRSDSASVKLHGRCGFRFSGRLEGSGYKHGRWLDTIFMQRSLNGGNASDPDPDFRSEQGVGGGR